MNMTSARVRSGESGIAMMSAILVIAVLSLVAILATQIAVHNNETSSVDRKRTQSIAAAEAGLDVSYKELSGVTYPCTITRDLDTKPTKSRLTATITYYGEYPAVTALPCTGANYTGTTVPRAAEINVVGTQTTAGGQETTQYGERQFQSLVKLNPVTSTSGFNKAIFANGNLAFNNNTTILGNVGNDADVYTNNQFVCSNSLSIQGSVIGQLGADLSNSCQVAVDLYVKNNINMSNSVNIGRDAKSSKGNISVTSPAARINHDAIAFGTITTASASNVGNAKIQGANIPDPTALAFPVVTFDNPVQAQWLSAGYTVVDTGSSCAATYAAVAAMATATGPKAIKTSCFLQWSNNTTITLAHDLAIFSTGGFAPTNRFEVRSSATGVKRKMYWIIPHGTAASPCSSPVLQTSNLTKFIDVDTFMYTPCSVSVNNNTSSSGQIYSGSNVTTANLFTLKFVPLPVWGASSGEPTAPTSNQVEIAYKREVKPTS
jgi:hypothetical protein